MKVYITRDSVTAGDDADAPHGQTLEMPQPDDVAAIVRFAVSRYRLASIRGGQATWVLASGFPLAVVAEQWPEPRLVCWPGSRLETLDFVDGVLGLHFSYLAQLDPELAVTVVRDLTLRAQW